MRTQMNAMLAESGLDPFESEELAAFLTMLESLVDESVPVPSPALAAMLSGGAAEAGVISLAARRHQNALAAAALALTGILATGVAAAANDLPPAVQRVVAEFSQSFLPFGFPYPEKMSENLTGQTDHTLEGSYDPDRWGGRGEGITDGEGMDDGEAQTAAQDVGAGHPQSVVDSSDRGDADDDSGANPESQDDEQESATQTNDGDGDGDAGSGDSGESSRGETDDLDTTAGDGGSEAEDLDDSSADRSGEGGGDDPDFDDGTEGSTPAVDG